MEANPHEEDVHVRVMVLIKANEQSEAGEMPSEQVLTEMTAFNEELVKAGVMLAGEGLHPSSKGARVRFDKDGKTTVTDGPFAETKEQLAGFYMIAARDLNEAIQIASKIPPARVGSVEIRPIRPIRETVAAASEAERR
jgi:hypothetical protein